MDTTELVAVIDGDGTAGLYTPGDAPVAQPWPEDWPETVSLAFLRERCADVVCA